MLPSAYQEVEYIESNGTQWINTGLNGTKLYRLDIQFNAANARQLFGAGPTGQEYIEATLTNTWSSVGFPTGNTPLLRNKVWLDVGTISDQLVNKWIEDATPVQGSSNNWQNTITKNIELFCLTNIGHLYGWSAKLYGFQAFTSNQNRNLEADMRPCYRIADGAIGLYDVVRGGFYTNGGTGVFAKGPDIYPEPIVHIDSHDYAIINKEDISFDWKKDRRNLLARPFYGKDGSGVESYELYGVTYNVDIEARIKAEGTPSTVSNTNYYIAYTMLLHPGTYVGSFIGKLVGMSFRIYDYANDKLLVTIQNSETDRHKSFVITEDTNVRVYLCTNNGNTVDVDGYPMLEKLEDNLAVLTANSDAQHLNVIKYTQSDVEVINISTSSHFGSCYRANFVEGKEYVFSHSELSADGTKVALSLYIYSDRLWGNRLANFGVPSSTNSYKWISTYTGEAYIGLYIPTTYLGQTIVYKNFQVACPSPYEPYNKKALIKSLSADFPLQQDLHGYDHPWGPGMGKNLIKVDESQMSGHAAAGTYYTTFCVNNNNINEFHLKAYRGYVLSALVECNISPSFCISIGAGNGGYDKDIIYTPYQDPGLRKFEVSFTPFDTHLSAGDILAIRVPNTGGHPQAYDYKIHWIQIEEDTGSGDPSPYEEMSNVCPITTYSGLDFDVVKTKYKNLFKMYLDRTFHQGIDYSMEGDALRIKGTAYNQAFSGGDKTYDNCPLKLKAGTYTVSAYIGGNRLTDAGYLTIGYVKKSAPSTYYKTTAGYVSSKKFTKTLSFNEESGIYFWVYTLNGSTVDYTLTIQIEEGPTASDYEPYAPSIYKHYSDIFSTPIAKGSFEHVSGKLTGLYKKVVFDGSESWQIQLGPKSAMLSNALPGIKANSTPISNYLRYTTSTTDSRKLGYFTFSGTRITLGNMRYINSLMAYQFWADAAAVKAYLAANPLEIAYELETPTSETITTDFIQLYDGKNVLSSDRDLKVTFFDGTEMMGKKFTILLISRYSTMPVHVETDSRFGPNLILPRTKPTHTRDNGWELMFLSKDTELPPGCVCEFDTIGGVIEVPVENSKCELPDSILEDLQANGVTGHVCAIGLNAKYVILDFNLEVVNRFWPYNV